MILSQENYFSKEANMKYMGVSMYKDFVGCLGRKGCEAQAIAKLKGEWEMKMTKPLLVGSYVDSHFSGTLDIFQAKHPEIFLKSGKGLLSDFRKAEEIIERIERDPYFMKFMSGEKQVVMTGEMLGVEWKIMVDSLILDTAIVDLKVMKELRKAHYVKDLGYASFVEFWGYDIQGGVYQGIVKENTNKLLPFFIAGASKEDVPDIEIISIDNDTLKSRLDEVKGNVERIVAIKNGEEEPTRCGLCDYCKHTKVLTKPMHFSDLYGEKI